MAEVLRFPDPHPERNAYHVWREYLLAKSQYELVRDNYYAGNWLMQKCFIQAEDEYAEATRKLMAVM